jgi:hypothetical protein
MKQLFSALLFLFSTAAFAQTVQQVDAVTFCSNKYEVPAGCTAESEYQVKCDNYSMIWIHMEKPMLRSMPDQIVNQMATQLKKFKKEKIVCYLLDKEVKGYRASFKTDSGTSYLLIAYGMVNEQPVFVKLSLDKEPGTNEDIPEFARQIIKLTR